MTPEQRRQRARLGGLTTAARGHVNTAPATAASERRFADEVRAEADAAGEVLTEDQVYRRAFSKRKLFYARLAYSSAKARGANARARRGLPPIEKAAAETQTPAAAGEVRRDRAERPPAA